MHESYDAVGLDLDVVPDDGDNQRMTITAKDRRDEDEVFMFWTEGMKAGVTTRAGHGLVSLSQYGYRHIALIMTMMLVVLMLMSVTIRLWRW